MSARVTTVNIHGVDPDDVKIDMYDTHAVVGITDAIGMWADAEEPLEAQLTRLAEIGETIREQALAEITRLVNARSLARLAEVSDA